jgi:hypothetical protein
MIKRRGNTAALFGAGIGAAHFIAICILAALVIGEQRSGMSHEYWEYAGIFDLPVSFVLLLLSPLLNLLSGVGSWPDVPFLPGIMGSWNSFLLPFLFYGVLGTAVWFLLGWGAIRLAGSRSLP